MENFRRLGIIEPILKSIEELRFEKPSEIQEKAIPLIVKGKDVIAGSATGSGKTLVFGARIIQSAEKGKGIQALILTPTRELAQQVTDDLKRFSKYKPLSFVMICGGLSIGPQIHALMTADVVVGTPGRILDHIGRDTINLSKVKILVLDEADRMLDMGFIDDVEKIIKKCPAMNRQTLLFSATIPRDIERLTKKYMDSPVRVSAEVYVDPKKLIQIYYDVQEHLKLSLLVHLLNNEKTGLVMVFCNSRRTTDFVANNLKSFDVDAIAIHGGLSQEKRNRTIKKFHSNKAHVLVCTDVAARGLDIPGVSHIYNYDIPKESKQYIHRIGRTARAGEEGKAVNFLSSKDHDNFTNVLRDNDVKIVKTKKPYVDKLKTKVFEYSNREGHRPRYGNPRQRYGHKPQFRKGFKKHKRSNNESH